MSALARLAARAAAVAAGGANPVEPVPSPCVSVCRMDDGMGLCEGCLRSLDEIARWSAMDEEDKRGVWRRIEMRVARQRER